MKNESSAMLRNVALALAVLLVPFRDLRAACQYSPYWGQNGELWNPATQPLKDYSRMGYHEGNDPIPYQKRSASKTYGAGRFTINSQITVNSGVLRGAGVDKTVLYFPVGMLAM